ncbi:hypothetical protein AWC38_SpisGene19962, partial [Stylophora pistillata]
TMEEFLGTGLASVNVLKLRPGSIIADLELIFNNSVGESYVSALLTQAANDGKLGSLEVEEVVLRKTFQEETKNNFTVGLTIKREFRSVYEKLENPETKMLVQEITTNTMEEFQGTGLASVNVLKLRNKVSGLVLVDYAKAFDMVDHELLLKKLELYNILCFASCSYSNSLNSSICMEENVEEALKLARNPLAPWYRYVDDTFMRLHEPTKANKDAINGFI